MLINSNLSREETCSSSLQLRQKNGANAFHLLNVQRYHSVLHDRQLWRHFFAYFTQLIYHTFSAHILLTLLYLAALVRYDVSIDK